MQCSVRHSPGTAQHGTAHRDPDLGSGQSTESSPVAGKLEEEREEVKEKNVCLSCPMPYYYPRHGPRAGLGLWVRIPLSNLLTTHTHTHTQITT